MDPPDTTNLSPLEATLMERLAATRVTVSAVLLAAEWEKDSHRVLNHEVTYDLVEWLLKDLNERGLVIYSLGAEMNVEDGGVTWSEGKTRHGVPVRIHVTDAGYRALGFDKRIVVTGFRRGYRFETPVRVNDPTDFRSHKMVAEYAHCERMTLEAHLDAYPDHRYNKGGF